MTIKVSQYNLPIKAFLKGNMVQELLIKKDIKAEVNPTPTPVNKHTMYVSNWETKMQQ